MKMKNTGNLLILTTLLSLSSCFVCYSQTTVLSGTVTDENGSLLSDVRIFINGDIQGSTNTKGEFSISVSTVKKNDKVRFWKTGYTFQTFQIRKIENPKDLKLKLAKSGLDTWKFSSGDKIKELFLNGVPLPEEEWNDINKKEVANIEVTSADPNHDMRTTNIVIMYVTTR